MTSYASNPINEPNPFGPASDTDVAAFEELVGTELPKAYRDYLLAFNGGKFQRKCFEGRNGAEGRIHHMYGLHSGPEYNRLSENWKLSRYYDIGEVASGVKNYIVFADTGTGDLLLIGLMDGAVYFLDHEKIDYRLDQWVAERINPLQLSASFDEFVEGLTLD